MNLLKSIILTCRANRYKYYKDRGGIAYIDASIKKGQTVCDIGAHKAGYLYSMLKKAGKSGKVFAFEPQSHLYNYLMDMKEVFKWDNVTIEHLALSDAPGNVTLYIPTKKAHKKTSHGATIVENKVKPNIGITENITTETLDSYCTRKNIAPDFLKIDVEGNELKVFQGGFQTLKKHKPKMIVEIEERHIGQEKVLEIFSFLRVLGYQGYFIHGKEYISLHEFNFDKYQNIKDKKNYCNNFIFE